MTVSEKTKSIDNKIKQNKAKYSLYKQTGSSGNVGENILPEKDLLEKASTIKRFEYLSSGNELESKQELKSTRFMDVIKE